jgi:hypothetical protein
MVCRVIGLACAAGLLVGCRDPADFTPAKGVRDLPRTETATRTFLRPGGCMGIGVVKGLSTADVAITVANHGGTHYFVTDERVLHEYTTSEEALDERVGKVAYSHQRQANIASTPETTAEAYRCPDGLPTTTAPAVSPPMPPPPVEQWGGEIMTR